jgi:two-component system cell cycle response regulator
MSDYKLSILLIIEDAALSKQIESLLQVRHYEVKSVPSLPEAIEATVKAKIHLILTQLFPSQIQNLEILQKACPHVPVVIYADQFDEVTAAKAIAIGAQDYITQLELNEAFISHVIDFAVERHKQQELLRELIFRDELTGIYNRRGFYTMALQQMELAKRFKRGFTIFLIDVDHLKKVNDTYGHQKGDLVLINTAKCLVRSFRSSDVIGRLGGDEFVILAHSASDDARWLEENLKMQIEAYNLAHRGEIALALSIGKAYFDPKTDVTIEELLEMADHSLYADKKAHHA